MPRKKSILPAVSFFAPFPPDIAKDFAHRCAQQTDPKIARLCKLCASPEREAIDYYVLIGASLEQMQAAADLDHAPRDLFEKHRDNHLMPLINAMMPSSQTLLQIPYPADDKPGAKERWHFFQFWAIGRLALAKENFNAAIMAQREMRLIDLESPHRAAMNATPVVGAEPKVDEATARDQAIVARFQQTPYRKPVGEDDDPEN
jgi:hypothetical protein